jgi:DNA-binding IclR family transcriptional regulator
MATRLARTAPQKPDPVYSAPALEKGIDIIELLGSEPLGLTVSDIAARLSRSISELFRVIVVLDRRGWLYKDAASDRYRVTYRLLEVAHRATPAQELTHVATPLMHSLSGKVMQSCHLVVANGARGLIIARQESPGTAGFAVRVGTTIDLTTSCSGRVLLAFTEPERRGALLGAGKTIPATLQARLPIVAAQGYESIPSARMAGVSDISCPIFGFDGHVVAALTIPFLAAIDESPHVSPDEARESLIETATAISSLLGWHDRTDTPIAPSVSVAAPVKVRRGSSARRAS